jgi:PAS domain-containing protein
MTGRDIEVVLLEQLASALAIPMFVLGPDGGALFFNEPAEVILGQRFEETGSMDREEWQRLLPVSDEFGNEIPSKERLLILALEHGEPVHRRFQLRGFDGVSRQVEATAIPLVGHERKRLGSLGLFWQPSAVPGAGTGQTLPRPAQGTAGSAQEVETILMRRLAARLATPIFLVAADGRLLYFNDAAEPILGCPFSEMAPVAPNELYQVFELTEEDGSPMAPDKDPLGVARLRCEPTHRAFFIRGLDGVRRRIASSGIPLIGQSGRMLGAAGFFWEASPS